MAVTASRTDQLGAELAVTTGNTMRDTGAVLHTRTGKLRTGLAAQLEGLRHPIAERTRVKIKAETGANLAGVRAKVKSVDVAAMIADRVMPATEVETVLRPAAGTAVAIEADHPVPARVTGAVLSVAVRVPGAAAQRKPVVREEVPAWVPAVAVAVGEGGK